MEYLFFLAFGVAVIYVCKHFAKKAPPMESDRLWWPISPEALEERRRHERPSSDPMVKKRGYQTRD